MRNIAVVAALVGCAPGYTASVVMTPRIVAERGTHTFAADRHRVFVATEGALKVLGYEVAFSDETVGVIKTAPHTIVTAGTTEPTVPGFAATTTTATIYARSYAIQLVDDQGQTRVEATPRMFAGGNDISQRDIWNLGVENNAWYQLFNEIGSNLGTAVLPPVAQP